MASFRAFRNDGRRLLFELRNSFGDVDLLLRRNMIDELLRGLVKEPVKKLDGNFVDDVSHIMYT